MFSLFLGLRIEARASSRQFTCFAIGLPLWPQRFSSSKKPLIAQSESLTNLLHGSSVPHLHIPNSSCSILIPLPRNFAHPVLRTSRPRQQCRLLLPLQGPTFLTAGQCSGFWPSRDKNTAEKSGGLWISFLRPGAKW